MILCVGLKERYFFSEFQISHMENAYHSLTIKTTYNFFMKINLIDTDKEVREIHVSWEAPHLIT